MKNTLIIIGIILITVIAGVFVVITRSNSGTQPSVTPRENMQKDEGQMKEGYSGKVLAGKASPYVEFSKADYEKAFSSGKVIFLDFYANWCPICRAEAPELKAGFDGLMTDKVVGFRVNFNDSETDDDEKALAQKFNIPYQHTKVILKNGKEVMRASDQWDKNMFITEINKVIQ